MTDYSTCRRCHTLMEVYDGDSVHPMCKPLPTRLERLRDNLTGLLALQAKAENPAALDDELNSIRSQIITIENRPPDMLKLALKYAGEWGWPVFPLRAGTKEPDTPHGFKDATVDLERIERYWRKHPRSNIGVPTGLPETFNVIDIDRPKRDGQVDGELAYKRMLDAGALPDTHAHVATANRGLHLYLEGDGSDGITTGFEPSVDYRGLGGYVVVPPSTTSSGRWAWLIVPSPVIRRHT
jgi:hypothetical protein